MSVLTHSPPPPPPAWTSSHLGSFKHSHMLSQGLHSLHGGAIYDRYHVFCHHLKDGHDHVCDHQCESFLGGFSSKLHRLSSYLHQVKQKTKY